jgi:uncharacterized protein YegL
VLWDCSKEPNKCEQDLQKPDLSGWDCSWTTSSYICTKQGKENEPPKQDPEWLCNWESGSTEWRCIKDFAPNPENSPGGSSNWQCQVKQELTKLECSKKEIPKPTPPPEPTPTPTPTPAPTPTPEPNPDPGVLSGPPPQDPQQYCNNALALVLVLDQSLSMDASKMSSVKAAASTLVQGLDEKDQAGLVTFDRSVRIAEQLTPDRASIYQRIQNITPDWQGMGTNITAGLMAASNLFNSAHDPFYKIIILLSDGAHNDPMTAPPESEAGRIKSANVRIITIGAFLDQAGASSLQAIASYPDDFRLAENVGSVASTFSDIRKSICR